MSGRFPYIVRYNTVFHLMRCLLRLQWVGTSPQALLCKLYELRRCESSLTTMQECLPLDTMILIIFSTPQGRKYCINRAMFHAPLLSSSLGTHFMRQFPLSITSMPNRGRQIHLFRETKFLYPHLANSLDPKFL